MQNTLKTAKMTVVSKYFLNNDINENDGTQMTGYL